MCKNTHCVHQISFIGRENGAHAYPQSVRPSGIISGGNHRVVASGDQSFPPMYACLIFHDELVCLGNLNLATFALASQLCQLYLSMQSWLKNTRRLPVNNGKRHSGHDFGRIWCLVQVNFFCLHQPWLFLLRTEVVLRLKWLPFLISCQLKFH